MASRAFARTSRSRKAWQRFPIVSMQFSTSPRATVEAMTVIDGPTWTGWRISSPDSETRAKHRAASSCLRVRACMALKTAPGWTKKPRSIPGPTFGDISLKASSSFLARVSRAPWFAFPESTDRPASGCFAGFSAERKSAPKGHPIYTNRIHVDDCAAVLEHLLFFDRADPLYIASDDDPVARCELLDWLADQLGRSEARPGRRGNQNPRKQALPEPPAESHRLSIPLPVVSGRLPPDYRGDEIV